MASECKICRREVSTLPLELESDEGERYTLKVCATCWDIISEIAKRTVLYTTLRTVSCWVTYADKWVEATFRAWATEEDTVVAVVEMADGRVDVYNAVAVRFKEPKP